MAQLILTAASGVASAAARIGVGAFLAQTVATTAAAYAAGYVSRALFGPRKRAVEGPRLESFQVQASQEGAPVPRVFGRARLAGQLIWAANFKEATSETMQSSGGKGGRPQAQTTFTEYLYSISFAVGLCEGEISRIGRVWADGKPFDLSKHNFRLHRGSETQNPDALIEAVEGAGAAPAFRGLAYVVFEDLPLKDFGNRIPQLSFEIEKPLRESDPGALENALTAVTMIPGSGEFVYGTTRVLRQESEGKTAPANVHAAGAGTDFTASLDALIDAAPNLEHVSLVVSWFGTSVDLGACEIRPGVDATGKTTTPYEWKAGGVVRAGAHLISSVDGAPAYGGTPADRAVVEAIAAMKAKGLKVMFHPFILMDAPSYPWRGRIDAGAADKTAAAATAMSAFFGAAGPGDFMIAGGEVNYAGPAEWSFRRMILHYAHLCALAGGVDAFLLGSELRGVTTTRDGAGAYPAVASMKTLAADVRSILGPTTQISYGADWSEYFGHQPADGSGDVFFHLDDFWSDPAVDFVGVDNYLPLADWRDGESHLDAIGGARGPYDLDYLKSNIEGGENFDWYYASAADRDAQIRSPIADSAYGEPWVYRAKDFKSWWANAHYNRPGGVRAGAPTSWTPQSKPIVFTEIGCPAIDKGANQPNVFVDPKSSESALPHYSTGRRDDLAQRRLIEAVAGYWSDAGNNPQSSVYSGAMIDNARSYVYAYDARPYPAFPARADIWGDAANWETGHWLNGRLGRAPLDLLIRALGEAAGFDAIDASALEGAVTGYIVDRPLSGREMIDPLADVFQFDIVETQGGLRCQPRNAPPVLTFDVADLAQGERDGPAFSLSLAQESDLPAAFRLGFLDEGADFSPAVAEARDPGARPAREAGLDIAAVLPAGEAEARARSVLADAWVMRETLSFSLPPSGLALEPGDAVILTDLGPDRRYRVSETQEAGRREVTLVRVSPSVYEAPVGATEFTATADRSVFAAPIWALFDLPLIEGADPARPWLAAYAEPWPGGVALYKGAAPGTVPILKGLAPARAVMGRLAEPLGPAGSGRFTNQRLVVDIPFGSFVSRSDDEIFAGANLIVIESANGAYELAQFRDAELVSPGRWRLSGLLRGQGGSEAEALAGAAAGARFVLMSRAVTQIDFSLNERDLVFDWQAGPDGEVPDTETFTARSLSFAARGLKPLSPVNLRASPEGGDIRLSWIRRTREGGDTWEGEVPLGELSERYAVTIFNGADPVRAVETTGPDYLYAAADIVSDFGPQGPGPSLSFAVAQLSDAVGAGVAASAEAVIR
ncbi:MAG: glycoside hydrolase/phage tail family protein [Pseudomonadota bacterium]